MKWQAAAGGEQVLPTMTDLSLIAALRAEVENLEQQYIKLDETLIINLMKRAAIQRLLIVYEVEKQCSPIGTVTATGGGSRHEADEP